MLNNLLLCAIMVKNEEERIIKTIATVSKYISYLVVLDTGSTDNTCTIIEEYCKKNNINLKIHRDEFVDFAYSRNVLLRHCYGLGEFVLLLDSNDEVRNCDVIVKYLKKIRNKKRERLFYCNYLWENDGKVYGSSVSYNRICLIRNNLTSIKYIHPVHEIIDAPNEYKKNNYLLNTTLCIYQDRMKDKPSSYRFKRDCEVLEKYLVEAGESTRTYRYLCQSYKNLGDWKKVFDVSNKLVEYSKRNAHKFSRDIYNGYLWRAQASYKLRKDTFKEYFEEAHNYHKILIETFEPYYELATAYYGEKDYESAYEYIVKACQVNDSRISMVPEIDMNLFKIVRHEFHMELAFLTNRIGEYKRVKDMLISKNLYKEINDPMYKYVINNSNKLEEVPANINLLNNLPDNVEISKKVVPEKNSLTREELIKKTGEYKLCIMVPYRDRIKQLEEFLITMSSFCNYLGINYHIYILNQNNDEPFNKGLLYNIGVKLLENEDKKYLCFHDVDIVPKKGTNYYIPDSREVNHLYGYLQTLGGIFTINYDDYIRVNGFSNRYDNWGYEDNDFLRRVVKTKININNEYFYERFNTDCYRELDEDREASIKKINLPSTLKNKELFERNVDHRIDGLDKLEIVDGSISYEYGDSFTLVNIDTRKVIQNNKMDYSILENKRDIYIYDNNFYPDLGVSKFCPPKYFNWKNIKNSNNIKIGKKDLVVYTDNYLDSRHYGHRKIAWLLEPPEINPNIYEFIKKNYNRFDFVITHNKELTKLDKRILYCINGMCWINESDFCIYSKSKVVSIIASGKTHTTGHKLRNKFVEYVNNNRGKLNYSVDIYGWSFNPLRYKLDGLMDYYFSIAIENSQSNNYFTEKIIDCFVTGTVPIYWGTPGLAEFFDINGVITFSTIEELDEILNNLTLDDYTSRMESIKYNYERAKEFVSPEDWMYKNLDIFKETSLE